MGLVVILFAKSFGPAVFISAAQVIFTNRLSTNLLELAPMLNTTDIESMGLNDLKASVGLENVQDVLLGLSKSLSQTWYLAVALSALTMVGSLGIK